MIHLGKVLRIYRRRGSGWQRRCQQAPRFVPACHIMAFVVSCLIENRVASLLLVRHIISPSTRSAGDWDLSVSTTGTSLDVIVKPETVVRLTRRSRKSPGKCCADGNAYTGSNCQAWPVLFVLMTLIVFHDAAYTVHEYSSANASYGGIGRAGEY